MKAPVIYIPNFVVSPDACYGLLRADLDWERREGSPRSEYYVNPLGHPYTYGQGKGVRTYQPRKTHFIIEEIRGDIERKCNCVFEMCFLNRYLDQKDQLGWHSDDSPDQDDERPIVSVSLGVEREIWFRPIGTKGAEVIEKLKLANGSAAIMAPGMQDTWQHRIPRADCPVGERISLTFRGYKTP